MFNNCNIPYSNKKIGQILAHEIEMAIKYITSFIISKNDFVAIMNEMTLFLAERKIVLELNCIDNNHSNYLQLFVEKNYDALYEYAKRMNLQDRSNTFKKFVKKVIIHFRKIYYFDLKLG